MLRDGHFLREPPVKIGAHHVRFNRAEATPQELMIQDALLGYKPPRKVSGIEVIALIVTCYAAFAVVFGLVKGFDWLTGN